MLLVMTAFAAVCEPDPGVTAVAAIPVEPLTIYFKSHAWGLNGYSAVLSLNKDPTRMPKPDAWECCPDDYRWPADSPPILVFRAHAGTLHIWDDGDRWHAPTTGSLATFVKFQRVDILTLSRMQDDPEAYGVQVIRNGTVPVPAARP